MKMARRKLSLLYTSASDHLETLGNVADTSQAQAVLTSLVNLVASVLFKVLAQAGCALFHQYRSCFPTPWPSVS